MKRLPTKEGKPSPQKDPSLASGGESISLAKPAILEHIADMVPHSADKNAKGSTGNTQVSASSMTESNDTAVVSNTVPHPTSTEPELVQCKHCKKSVPAAIAAAHSKACLKEKQERAKKKKEAAAKEKEAKEAKEKEKEKEKEKAKEKDKEIQSETNAKGETVETASIVEAGGEKTKNAKKSSAKAVSNGADEGNKKSKKRKADADAEKAPKPKKKKEEPKPKLPKPKGLIPRLQASLLE